MCINQLIDQMMSIDIYSTVHYYTYYNILTFTLGMDREGEGFAFLCFGNITLHIQQKKILVLSLKKRFNE